MCIRDSLTAHSINVAQGIGRRDLTENIGIIHHPVSYTHLAVDSGQTVFGREVVSKLPNLIHPQKESYDYRARDISPRELEIIRLIAEGLSNREIASELFLSEGTVRNYLSSILDKLSLRDRTQVAEMCIRDSRYTAVPRHAPFP